MGSLIKLFGKRMVHQKFIWFFLLCFLFVSYAYAFLISNPGMESMLNVDAARVGNYHYPEFMLRFFGGIVGLLFVTFIACIYMCEELQSGMFYEPLLHSKSRNEILNSKILTLCITTFAVTVILGVMNYLIAYLRWGTSVFKTEEFESTICKYFLLSLFMCCLELGIIAVTLYTRKTLITIGVSVIYLVIDTIINSNALFEGIRKFWFGYYMDNWIFTREFSEIPGDSICEGVTVIITYGILFYLSAYRKIKKMDFSR